jgi:hypothetical protein
MGGVTSLFVIQIYDRIKWQPYPFVPFHLAMIRSIIILSLAFLFVGSVQAQSPSTAWRLLEREMVDHPAMVGEFVRPTFFWLQGFDGQANPTTSVLSHLSFDMCADSSFWRFGVSGTQYSDPDMINSWAQISIANTWKLGRWRTISFGASPSLNYTFLPQDKLGIPPDEDFRQTMPNLSLGMFYSISHTRIHLTFRNVFDNSDKLAVNDQPSVITKLGHTFYLNRLWNFTGMVQYHQNLVSDNEVLEFGLKIRRKEGTCVGVAYTNKGDWSVYLKPRLGGNHIYPFVKYETRQKQRWIVAAGIGVLLKDPKREKYVMKGVDLGFIEKLFQEDVPVVLPPHYGTTKKQQERLDIRSRRRSMRKMMRTDSKKLE